MTEFLKRLRKIRAMESEAEAETVKLLRDMRWTYSSKYADYYWRWSKEIEGRMITTTNAEEALRLEERITPCDEDCYHED